ncbi:MAG TPA: hypothetical protein PKG95_05620 [Anaerolineaceae bacterium]|jgi:uncharacterized membrane protein|nr:hypothetical protein [Anaerolineaceae bacterium]
MKTVIFALATSFHDLFTVIWIGGLIVTLISYLPSLKSVFGHGPQVKQALAAFQKRQSVWVYISMAGLLLTGIMLSQRDPQFGHLFEFSNPFSIALSLKHLLILLMIAVTLYRSLALAPQGAGAKAKREKLSFLLQLINAVLAILVLFASGAIAALSQS